MLDKDRPQAREEKIRRTIAEFGHFTDSGNYEEWVGLFTETGSYHMFGQSHVGHKALRAFIEDDQPPHRRGLHLTTDSLITFVGDCARVRSNFIFVASGDAAPVIVAGGQYHDILVPRDERWLFQERETTLFGPTATVAWGRKGFDDPKIVPWFAVTRTTPLERRGTYDGPQQQISPEK